MKEPDIANSVIYKVEDVVYVFDTGATTFFGRKLIKAKNGFQTEGKYRKIIFCRLINLISAVQAFSLSINIVLINIYLGNGVY